MVRFRELLWKSYLERPRFFAYMGCERLQRNNGRTDTRIPFVRLAFLTNLARRWKILY